MSLVLLLAAALVHAGEPDPTKDPRYKEFHDAPLVIVAKLDAAKVTAVLDSYPAQYILALRLTPSEVLRGPFARGTTITVSHRIIEKVEPRLAVGTSMVVRLARQGKGYRVVKMEPATKELVQLAKSATTAAKEQEKREAELAKKDPTGHPRYKGFKDADGIAVVSLSPDGAVSFDVRGITTYDLIATDVLKGDLKAGKFKGMTRQQKHPGTAKWLVTFKRDGGNVWLLSTEEATPTLLLVAKVAAKK
jgi:hypothetical protein